jgi:hypothetical protein
MMKIFAILIALIISGCSSQQIELMQEEKDIHVFYEEPKIEYEVLDRINTTRPDKHPMDTLNTILRRAAELGADGVIVHSLRKKGTVAGQHDKFGTGGGDGVAVYQVRASAIRYIN